MQCGKPDRRRPCGPPVPDRSAVQSREQQYPDERALHIDRDPREEASGERIQEHALNRYDRKQDEEASQSRGHRLRAYVDQERRILLPASAKFVRSDEARQNVQYDHQGRAEYEHGRESGGEDLPGPDGQPRQRQVIAPAGKKGLPLDQRKQAGDREHQGEEGQFVGKGRGAERLRRRE